MMHKEACFINSYKFIYNYFFVSKVLLLHIVTISSINSEVLLYIGPRHTCTISTTKASTISED